MTNITPFKLPKSFIGFDRMLSELENLGRHANDAYPPFNIVHLNDKSRIIELAMAGFSREDLTIEVKDNILTISGDRQQRRPEEQYVHRGISNRKFVKSFRLSEYAEVTGAELRDGILTISLEVKLPEEQLPKLIKIK